MLVVADVELAAVEALLNRYDIRLIVQRDGETITGSYWGGREAGLVGRCVYVRNDTPVHSLLHETCHVICMSADRRAALHCDAGGDDLEEAAVCYLQVILAAGIDGVGSARLMQDMDAWGYSFRLGSTARWFAEDAQDACNWLIDKGLLTVDAHPTFRLRP